MNDITVFNNEEFGNVRVVEENGNCLFSGIDVARVLGYSNQRDALNRHCRYVVKRDVPHPQSPDKTIEMSFIPESDMYRLAFGSKLPNAERFTDWVTSEVLPTLRKTGSYSMSIPKDYPSALRELANEYEKRTALEEQAKLDAPKVQFANTIVKSEDNILMREMAKLLNNDGISIGQNRLFKLLREKGVLMDNNEPYQAYVDQKYFVTNEGHYDVGGKIYLSKTTMVTPKGQIWIANKIKDWLNVKPNEEYKQPMLSLVK